MSGFVDPVAGERARADNRNLEETRAKFQNWWYLIYQNDDAAALNAKNMLLDAIETQHESARALVDQVMPGRKQRRLMRPLSKDEGGDGRFG